MKQAILCDLDGTLALHVARGPYDEMRCDTDAPNLPVVELLEVLQRAYGDDVLFVSARHERAREKTVAWLKEHVTPDGADPVLYMRADGDDRSDAIVKEEIYRREIEPHYAVRVVLDDRRRVVEAWRRMGLFCLQVADGEF
jgi:hypothetical protein